MLAPLLLLVSTFCLAIATAIGFTWIDSTYGLGWLALGLLLLVASMLVGPARGYLTSRRSD